MKALHTSPEAVRSHRAGTQSAPAAVLPVRAASPVGPDGVRRVGAYSPLDRQNRVQVRTVLTPMGWDQGTDLVVGVEGGRAVITQGLPTGPHARRVPVDAQARLTLPPHVVALLGLQAGDQVSVAGVPATGQVFLRSAAASLQDDTGPLHLQPAPAQVEAAPSTRAGSSRVAKAKYTQCRDSAAIETTA